MMLGDRVDALLPWQRRGVLWGGALLIGVIAALAAFDIVRAYRATVDDTGRELETHARIIAEQTTRTLQAVDVVLRHVAVEHERGRLAKLNPEDLHAYLRQQAVGLTQIEGLALYDAGGDPLAVSWLEPRTGVNIAKLQGFSDMRDNASLDLVVSEALRSPRDGRWMFPLARRLGMPDGRFAGLLGARVRIEYFEDFYRNVRLERGTTITLVHTNGTLVASFPPAEAAMGQRLGLFDTLLAASAAGFDGPVRSVSPLDGGDTLATMHMVADYPLAVIVSRDVAQALAPWRQQAQGTAGRTLALAALAALFLLLLTRKLARLQATQTSLRTVKDRFALAVAGSDDGIWDWDQKTNLLFASARARELYGLPPGPEVQSKDAWFAAVQVHPDDAETRGVALEAHMSGQTPLFESEYRVRHLDGTYHWIRVRGLCVRNAEGQPLRMAGSVSDIHARKQAEEALRESEERYQLAVTGVNEGLWDWDLASDHLFLSPRAQETLRPRARRAVRAAPRLDCALDAPPRRPGARAARACGSPARANAEASRSSTECCTQAASGTGIASAASRCAMRTTQAYRMAGSMEDITERKHAEAERERLETQLRQAQKLEAIGTLAGGIAHDFNNILAAILGYGEMAQKERREGTSLRRHIDAAMSAGMRAKSLVERILAFSRSGMGERVPVHVQSVVAEALDLVGRLAAGGRALEQAASQAGDAAVLGDPTQVHQVVMNLCANAVQAMKAAKAR